MAIKNKKPEWDGKVCGGAGCNNPTIDSNLNNNENQDKGIKLGTINKPTSIQPQYERSRKKQINEVDMNGLVPLKISKIKKPDRNFVRWMLYNR